MLKTRKSVASPLRRRLLQGVAGAALASPMLPKLAYSQSGPTRLVFAANEDASGTVSALVEDFNAANEGHIEVVIRSMPAVSDNHRRLLESELLIGSEEIDVISADVIWTAQFAYNGWVRDLTGRFFRDLEPSAFLHAPLESTQYRNRTWAVPWFTDTGMIFYRKDLLAAAELETPTNWEELQLAALALKESADLDHGFVFQGDVYEGGVTNALEYIWSAGGRVMTPQPRIFGTLTSDAQKLNVINVDSSSAAQGLDIARGMISSGAAPLAVTMMDENASNRLFLNGQAAFLRSWPSLYGEALAGNHTVGPGQIGILPVPGASASIQGVGCLGGWNLMITASSSKVDAAWEFIRYATSREAQKKRAIEGSFLPTLSSLYEGPEITDSVPVVELGRSEVASARPRPSSPVYNQVSPRIAIAFNRVLTGELSGEEAVKRLSDELNVIMRKNSI